MCVNMKDLTKDGNVIMMEEELTFAASCSCKCSCPCGWLSWISSGSTNTSYYTSKRLR